MSRQEDSTDQTYSENELQMRSLDRERGRGDFLEPRRLLGSSERQFRGDPARLTSGVFDERHDYQVTKVCNKAHFSRHLRLIPSAAPPPRIVKRLFLLQTSQTKITGKQTYND